MRPKESKLRHDYIQSYISNEKFCDVYQALEYIKEAGDLDILKEALKRKDLINYLQKEITLEKAISIAKDINEDILWKIIFQREEIVKKLTISKKDN